LQSGPLQARHAGRNAGRARFSLLRHGWRRRSWLRRGRRTSPRLLRAWLLRAWLLRTGLPRTGLPNTRLLHALPHIWLLNGWLTAWRRRTLLPNALLLACRWLTTLLLAA
jgi:hypothetical protein